MRRGFISWVEFREQGTGRSMGFLLIWDHVFREFHRQGKVHFVFNKDLNSYRWRFTPNQATKIIPFKKESQELISIFWYVTPSFMCTHLLFSRVLLCFNKEGRFNDSEDKHEAIKKAQKIVRDVHSLDFFLIWCFNLFCVCCFDFDLFF